MTRFIPAALVLALGLNDGSLVDAAPAPETPGLEASAPHETDGTRLELQTSPLVDLYFAVRAQAAERDSAPLPGYEAAVDAARALQRPLGRFGGWGPLDSQVFLAADASELLGGFVELPEPYERRGRTISIRDDAVGLATAIQELMPGFVGDLWPTRRAELEGRIAFLRTEFMPRHQEALAFMMQSLAIPDPGVTVPVFLVIATNPTRDEALRRIVESVLPQPEG